MPKFEKSNFYPSSVFERSVWAPDHSSQSTTTGPLLGESDVVEGTGVRGWRELIRVGGDASSGYARTVIEKNCSDADLEWGYDYSGTGGDFAHYSKSGHVMASAFQPTLPDADLLMRIQGEANSLMSNKFYRRASGIVAQGMTVVGELRETVELLKHPMKGLDTLTRNMYNIGKMRSLRAGRGRQAARDISDQYLKWKFGVEPIINDTQDILKAIEAFKRPKYQKFSVKADSSWTDIGSTTFGPGGAIRDVILGVSIHALARGYGAAALPAETEGPTNSLQSLLGFDLDNFIPTAYELIPYSFVVDYFTNCGDILNAACVCLPQFNFAGSSMKSVQRAYAEDRGAQMGSAFFTVYPGSGYHPYESGNCGRVDHARMDYVRTRLIPQIPQLIFSLPGAGQSTNLGALIMSHFNRRD